MNVLPRDSELDLFSLAGAARDLLVDTRARAGMHIESLKSQLDELWRSAEEMLPVSSPADLIEHVERTLEDLRSWSAIGLSGKFAT